MEQKPTPVILPSSRPWAKPWLPSCRQSRSLTSSLCYPAMADLKEKSRKKKSIKGKSNNNEKSNFLSKTSKPDRKGRMKKKGKMRDDDQRKRRGGGPRIPNVLRKELGILDPKRNSDSDSDSDGGEDVRDVYELEEEVAQEESGRNRRFDEVENYEYELPEDFKVSLKRELFLSTSVFNFYACVLLMYHQMLIPLHKHHLI